MREQYLQSIALHHINFSHVIREEYVYNIMVNSVYLSIDNSVLAVSGSIQERWSCGQGQRQIGQIDAHGYTIQTLEDQ